VPRGRGRVRYQDVVVGSGALADRGSQVDIRYTLALNNGDVVQADEHALFRVGQRTVFAGLDYVVEGMRVGGTRQARVGPHLGYGADGVSGKISPDAVLDLTVRLLAVTP